MSDATHDSAHLPTGSTAGATGWTWVCAAVLVITTAALQWPLVNETRIWDDDRAIFANPTLLPPSTAALRQAWLEVNQSQYNPVTHTLWWAIAHIAHEQTFDGPRLDARVFHAANLFVHVLAGLTVLFLLRRLVRFEWAALAGAMLFAIHPVQVETVAWIFGMRDLLCGLLSLVAVHQYIVAALEPEQRRIRYMLALLAFIAAILSKSAAVVVPGMLLVIDLLVLRRDFRRAILWVLPFVLLAVPCIAWMPFVQPAFAADTVRWALRPLIAADALAFYLWKLVLPFDLAVDYGRMPSYVVQQGWIWWTWIFPAGVAVLLWLLRRRVPVLIAAALLFVITLAPVLGIKRFDFQGFSTVADRYLYLPMLGVALAAAWMLDRRKPILWIFAWLALAALGWRTLDQTGEWQSRQQVWEHTARVNPRSWSAWHGLATQALWNRRFDEAEKHARHAIDVGGDYYTVRGTLAIALERQNRYAETREQLQWIIDNRPDLTDGFIKLADFELRRGRTDIAIALLEAAVERHPNDPEVRRLLDHLLARRR